MRNEHVETLSGGRLMTDHREIRDWAEARAGTPAIEQTKEKDVAERLCIRFADEDPNPAVYEISWGEFFQRFETAQLAMRVRGGAGHDVKFERRETES